MDAPRYKQQNAQAHSKRINPEACAGKRTEKEVVPLLQADGPCGCGLVVLKGKSRITVGRLRSAMEAFS